jgi:hypothetical protein
LALCEGLRPTRAKWQRGREPAGEVEDWLTPEREMLGRPPLRIQKNDRDFQLQVPFDDYDVNHVEILVTPSEIIVHEETNAEQMTEESDWVSATKAAAEQSAYARA